MADQLFQALQQFYGRFPSQLENDLFIFGISYGGKYVPSLATRILARYGFALGLPYVRYIHVIKLACICP